MRLTTYIIFFLFLVTTLSCEDDIGQGISPTTDLSLGFTSSYDGTPLIFDKVYPYKEDFKVQFSQFQFFISYISLVQEEDNATLVSDIRLIDFAEANQDSLSALQGLTFDFYDLPIGNYTGIKFGLGVIADLNRTKPEDYGNTHPLFDPSNYRPSWDSYVFAKIGGSADLNNDEEFNHSLIYEIASDAVYRDIVFEHSITLEENAPSKINIDIDLNKLFVNDLEECIDIESDNIIYENIDIMQFFVNNFRTASQISQ